MDASKLVFPQEGEIVYSVLQRTHEMTGIPISRIRKALTEDRSNKGVLTGIPARLAELSDHVPRCHPWANRETFALKYTLFPYYTYFDSECSRRSALELINGDSSAYLKAALGVTQGPGELRGASLRVCRTCIANDELRIGFSYFHREHQVPASVVCWRHGCLLEIGCVKCGRYPLNVPETGMPGICKCGESGCPIYEVSDADEIREPMEWLAKEIAYLLHQGKTTVLNFREKLKKVILQRGLAAGSTLKYSLLAHAIEERFGASFLGFLGYPAWTSGRPSPWLRRALQERNRRTPTLVYLLLTGVVSSTVPELEEKSDSGPGQPVIMESSHPANAESQDSVEEWKRRLPEVLSGASICDAANCLGVTINQIAREAILQKIRVPLSGRCGVRTEKLHAIHDALIEGMPQTEVMQKYDVGEWLLQRVFLDRPDLFDAHEAAREKWYLEMHKSKITAVVESNPGISLVELRRAIPASYEYVQGREKLWLRGLLQPRKGNWRSPENRRRVSDSEIAERVQAAVEEIEAKPRPTRITVWLILRTAGLGLSIDKRLADLPLTEAVVAQHTETLEAFRERKIRWAIGELADSNVPISVNTLRRKAGMPREWLYPIAELVRRVSAEIGAEVHLSSFFAK